VLRPALHRLSGLGGRPGLGGVGHQQVGAAVDVREQRVSGVKGTVGDQPQNGATAASAELEVAGVQLLQQRLPLDRRPDEEVVVKQVSRLRRPLDLPVQILLPAHTA
jgi:hypothetical protein